MVVALAGWINRQQVALLETGGRSVLGTLPPGPKLPGLGEQGHRTRFWIGRGSELPLAAWWIASLLPPGCRVKPCTTSDSNFRTLRGDRELRMIRWVGPQYPTFPDE